MKKKMTLLMIGLVLLAGVAAVRGIGIVEIVKHYPSVFVANGAGCRMNYDLVWIVTEPGGAVILETPNEAEAILALLVCP